jgi:hypothetical protein
MIIIILIPIELVVLWAGMIWYFFNFFRLASRGIKIKQANLRIAGHVIALVGIAVGIALPNIFGIQSNNSDIGDIIYLVATAFSILLFFLGWGLISFSYKSKEENPKWVRGILKVLE